MRTHSFRLRSRGRSSANLGVRCLLAAIRQRINAGFSRVQRYGLDWRRDALFAKHARADRQALETARHEFGWLYRQLGRPLVSVTIATFNRAALLVERTIPTVQSQTYDNFELVIVGDGCTDETSDRLSAINDSRIRYYNLPARSAYPSEPHKRWQVAGSTPLNRALELARGEWIAHLDDDDMFEPDHIKSLLDHATRTSVELVYGNALVEEAPGQWTELTATELPNGRSPYGKAGVPHSSAFFRSYLRLF